MDEKSEEININKEENENIEKIDEYDSKIDENVEPMDVDQEVEESNDIPPKISVSDNEVINSAKEIDDSLELNKSKDDENQEEIIEMETNQTPVEDKNPEEEVEEESLETEKNISIEEAKDHNEISATKSSDSDIQPSEIPESKDDNDKEISEVPQSSDDNDKPPSEIPEPKETQEQTDDDIVEKSTASENAVDPDENTSSTTQKENPTSADQDFEMLENPAEVDVNEHSYLNRTDETGNY